MVCEFRTKPWHIPHCWWCWWCPEPEVVKENCYLVNPAQTWQETDGDNCTLVSPPSVAGGATLAGAAAACPPWDAGSATLLGAAGTWPSSAADPAAATDPAAAARPCCLMTSRHTLGSILQAVKCKQNDKMQCVNKDLSHHESPLRVWVVYWPGLSG